MAREVLLHSRHDGLHAESAADQLGARFTKGTYQMTLQGPSTDELYKYATHALRVRCARCPTCVTSAQTSKSSNPQIFVNINRDKAHELGLTAQAIENALADAYGSLQISTIYAPNNEYWVELELEPQYQADPAALNLLYVRSLERSARAAQHRRAINAEPGPALRQPFRASFPQSRSPSMSPPASRSARRSAEVKTLTNDIVPASITAGYSGEAEGFRILARQSRDAPLDGDPRHLPRPWHPLRKLHPSVDDSVRPARGWLRRHHHPDGLPSGTRPAGLRRHHHAGRPRQEKRHHDDRLRPRRPTHRRQKRRRRHFRRLHGPFPARS